jgi:hypothetical protein
MVLGISITVICGPFLCKIFGIYSSVFFNFACFDGCKISIYAWLLWINDFQSHLKIIIMVKCVFETRPVLTNCPSINFFSKS